MTGGINSAVAKYSAVIALPAHGFTLALPVGYTAAGASIGGLTTNTTYYVIPVSADSIALALTSTGAISGSSVTVTSVTNQATAHAPTLQAVVPSGTPSFKWQMSNNDTDYVDVNISSITVSAYTYPYATTAFEFNGFDGFNYRYLRLNVIAPTAGGLKLQAVIAAKE